MDSLLLFNYSVTPWLCDPMNWSMPGFLVFHYLPEFDQTHVHWICDAIQPLSPPFPPAFNLCQHQGFFPNELALHIRWPKYWSFNLNIGPSNEYSGLISFRTDWLDLLAVQGTLKSLLQHHSLKASILWLINTWKDAQHHSLLEKCKWKPQWGFISHQLERPPSKSLQAINAGEGVEKREPSYTVGGNAN